MRSFYRLFATFVILTMILSINIPSAYSKETDKAITILFTHDLHDHFYPFNVEKDGKTTEVGGYAKLYSAIEHEREKDPEAILVDAGDYSMGTLFQTIFASDAPNLRVLGEMGYDAITFGNHEFDFRAKGLTDNLNAALQSGDSLPEIVATNTSFPKDEDGNLTPSLKDLKEAMINYDINKYTIIEREGVKIGVIGLMGEDADSNAPMSEVVFDDMIESSKTTVDTLKNKENVDLIVAISHSGTSNDKSKSEDEILAKEVPGIDVIISGHSHTVLEEPILVGDTILGSTGEYGENLGVLNISQNTNGDWQLDNYKLQPIDDSLSPDPTISEMIENYKDIIQEKYLDNYDMEFSEVLAYTPFNFTAASQLGAEHEEDRLGNLISDSYIYTIKEMEGTDYEPIAASIEPVGIIRGSFVKGDITVSDVFNMSSLGIGPDEVSGYPLLDIYLTGKELKIVAEVDASVTPLMNSAQLYIAGLSYTFNPNRLIFNKVTDVSLQDYDGAREEIDDNKLYRIVTGLYSAQMLPVVNEKSFGLLSVTPKTKDGTPIANFEDEILYDHDDQEIKEWYAIANYLQSFEDKDGVPVVDSYYEQTQDRKIVDDNSNIFAILKNPNGIALATYGIIVGIIGIIILITLFIIRRRKRRKRKKLE